MAEKYYIDTCIWRDYFEGRDDGIRPIGEWAFQLFKHIKEKNHLALYSNLIIEELKVRFSKKQINEVLRILQTKDLLLKVKEPTEEQLREAKTLAKRLRIPTGDCIHAILSRDSQAILVSRDKHFQRMKDIVKISKPEEII